MAALPPPLVRRPIATVVLVLAVVAGILLTPVALPVLAVVDGVTRSPARRLRVWCLVLAALLIELAGLVASIALTVWSVRRLDRPVTLDRFHRLEQWWVRRHARNLRRFAGVRWVIENPDDTTRGNAVVLARHGNHADAILPVLVFGTVGGRRMRYTLKTELQWAPAMDIVGNRLPNVFVDRHPPTGSPIESRLEALTAGLDNRDVAVIFPEGTFYSADRLDRAAVRIAATHPDLEAPARSLKHLLPPRPAGTLALLRGAPRADLVLVAHEGMEVFGDLATIARRLPLRDPVRVRVWRIPRADVPPDEAAIVPWLLDRWLQLDRWIEARVTERSRGEAGAPPPEAREIEP
ncbi:MAG: 1-acyl-sn-glycerol-3-phosphate acyltransferase [Acidimicrobiales bacterium]